MIIKELQIFFRNGLHVSKAEYLHVYENLQREDTKLWFDMKLLKWFSGFFKEEFEIDKCRL